MAVLHGLAVVVDVLILVIGRIAGVYTVHVLHDTIGSCSQLLGCLARRQGLIGVNRLGNVQIHEWPLAEQAAKSLTGTEGHGDRNQGLVVFDGVGKHRELEGTDIGIEVPHRALGKYVQPSAALDDLVHTLLEGYHRMNIPLGDGHTAQYPHEGLKATFKIDLPCGKIADMGADRLQHAEIVPHKDVIGDRDRAVFKLLAVLFQVLTSVYPQTVGQVCDGKDDEMQDGGDQRTLDPNHTPRGI